jgi:DNA-binding CsgD family transcriptional regulator
MRRDMGTVPQRWVDPAGDVSEADDDDELAAPSLAEAVALATRGRGRRSRPSIGWEALTPAELAVVALVAEGHTNVEIAERLFVSRRTVATHLEHVFTKVGVRTRAELAAMAARRRR